MDLRTASRVSRLALPLLTLAILATSVVGGCADPCIDDGLGQKFCPQDDGTDSADSVGTDPDGVDSADTGCPALSVILIPQTPTMVLLVDQSSSMETAFGSSTRWETIRDVLVDPQTGIVAQFAASIRFGATLYSSMDGDMGGACPLLTEVDPAIDNFPAIESLLVMSMPIDETPTGESLALVADKLAALDVAGNKYIVLATDGEPDT
ncbi:MAG: VWA domain-containing protein, partial [Myxococcales bacterium]|nr:VWA domain-containing protein [Myxococcales bacterium]